MRTAFPEHPLHSSQLLFEDETKYTPSLVFQARGCGTGTVSEVKTWGQNRARGPAAQATGHRAAFGDFLESLKSFQCWGVYDVLGPVHPQTFPRSELRLTIEFLATEEHGSRASPELESDWRRELQVHRDLQAEGCGGKSREDRVARAPPGWGLASCRNTQLSPQTPTTDSRPLHLSVEVDSGGEEC